MQVPEGEVGEKLKAEFAEGKEITVAVMAALGQEHIISFKESTK